ncbi:MAG: hypothetical protein SFU85_09280 [Candidatus Methylacidiphilales bacterium]|nr:hypothetical protein [Candidatus Methylacidiphilales bacterium]
MDRQTSLLLLAFGIIGTTLAVGAQRTHALKKARALRASFRPHFREGCYLVKIIAGPKWSVGEFGTFDAAQNKVLIEGEEFDAEEFEFILA